MLSTHPFWFFPATTSGFQSATSSNSSTFPCFENASRLIGREVKKTGAALVSSFCSANSFATRTTFSRH
jgi:hypothetical protein